MLARLTTLAVLGAAGAYLVLALPYPRGVPARPGPGFFPLLVGVFLCGVALVFVARSLRGRLSAARPVPAAATAGALWGRVGVTAAGLVGFGALLPWAGFPITTFLFVTALLKRLGGGRWSVAAVSGAVTAVLAYYFFAVLLDVPLPRGPGLD